MPEWRVWAGPSGPRSGPLFATGGVLLQTRRCGIGSTGGGLTRDRLIDPSTWISLESGKSGECPDGQFGLPNRHSYCPPPIRRTVLSGSVVHAQLLGFEEGRFAVSGGALTP